MKNTSNVVIGILAGLAAGAALGILLAPDKGSETRDRLSQSLKDLGEHIKDIAADQIDKVKDAKEQIVRKAKDKAEGRLNELEDDIEHA